MLDMSDMTVDNRSSQTRRLAITWNAARDRRQHAQEKISQRGGHREAAVMPVDSLERRLRRWIGLVFTLISADCMVTSKGAHVVQMFSVLHGATRH